MVLLEIRDPIDRTKGRRVPGRRRLTRAYTWYRGERYVRKISRSAPAAAFRRAGAHRQRQPRGGPPGDQPAGDERRPRTAAGAPRRPDPDPVGPRNGPHPARA